MTEITFSHEDMAYEVIVDGHTDPIVCSGISAIVYALYGCLKNKDISWEIEEVTDGHVHIKVTSMCMRADEDFLMAYIGLKQIESGYPDKLKVFGNVGEA